jgi:hypothetical protein
VPDPARERGVPAATTWREDGDEETKDLKPVKGAKVLGGRKAGEGQKE